MLPRLQPHGEEFGGASHTGKLRTGGVLHSARGAPHSAGIGNFSGLAGAQQPHSARGPRQELQEQLLPHEETVRAVYKKHAQSFFEEIKDGFMKEAAMLRKHAQKAFLRPPGQAPSDTEPTDAGPQGRATDQRQQQMMAAMMAKLEKQQEELSSLSRNMHAENNSAKKAALTPLWKERALHEIAQTHLREVCMEEVRRAFKELSESFDDSRVEAAVTRLSASSGLPSETALRKEIKEQMAVVHQHLSELSLRADESTAARAVLVDCCNALEERQRQAAKRFDALQTELREFRDEWASCRSMDLEGTDKRFVAVRSHAAESDEQIAKEQVARSEAISRISSRIDEMRAKSEAIDRRLGECMAKTIEAAQKAEDGCRLAQENGDEARKAREEATRAGAAAAHARSEGEAARGLAAGAVEATVRNEATAAHFVVKVNALEGQIQEFQIQLRHHVETAESRVQTLTDGAKSHSDRLELLEAERKAASGSPQQTCRPRTAEGATGDQCTAADDSADSMYAAARLRAHLDFVEARIKELQRQSDTLGEEISARARRAMDTSMQHTARLEALELRVGEVHRHTSTLSGEVGAHGRRLVDVSTQNVARLEALEDRFRGMSLRVTALDNDVGGSIKRLSEQVAGQASTIQSLDERTDEYARQVRRNTSDINKCNSTADQALAETRALGGRMSSAEVNEDALRRDLSALSLRLETFDVQQRGSRQDFGAQPAWEARHGARDPPLPPAPVQSQLTLASHAAAAAMLPPPAPPDAQDAASAVDGTCNVEIDQLRERFAGYLFEAQKSGSLDEAVQHMLQKELGDKEAQQNPDQAAVGIAPGVGLGPSAPKMDIAKTGALDSSAGEATRNALLEFEAIEARHNEALSVSQMSRSSSVATLSLADEVSGRLIQKWGLIDDEVG